MFVQTLELVFVTVSLPCYRTTTPGDTQLLATEVYDLLQSSSTADGDCMNEMNSRRRKAQFFLGATNKRAKTVVLHIDGLEDTVNIELCCLIHDLFYIVPPTQTLRFVNC